MPMLFHVFDFPPVYSKLDNHRFFEVLLHCIALFFGSSPPLA